MATRHSNNQRLFADDVWKTRIQLLWVVLSILYSFAAGQQGLLGRSAGETSTILLIFSGFIVSAMFVHILNREDQRAPEIFYCGDSQHPPFVLRPHINSATSPEQSSQASTLCYWLCLVGPQRRAEQRIL